MKPADAPATISDAVLVDVDTAGGQPGAQAMEPGGIGVAERTVEGPAHGLGGDAGKRRRRLPDLQMEDPVSRGFELGRRPAHRHGVEGRHGSGPERSVDHRSIVPARQPGAARGRVRSRATSLKMS